MTDPEMPLTGSLILGVGSLRHDTSQFLVNRERNGGAGTVRVGGIAGVDRAYRNR